MKSIKLTLFLSSLVFLNISCSNTDDNQIRLEEEPGFINCYQVKEDFLIYVSSKKDEIIPILIREMKKEEGDNELTAQRVFDGVQSYSFMSKWDNYEKILKNNCPEEHQKFQEEVGMMLLTELLNNPEFNQ